MQVGIVLGTRSQWSTIQHTAKLLAQLGITYEARIITVNKSSKRLHEYASNALNRGLEIIIAGSTGSIYLSEIIAAKTDVPVVEIQTNTSNKKHCDIPFDNNICNKVRIFNTGPEGAVKAALFAASMLATKYPRIHENLMKYHSQNELVKAMQ